MGEYKWVKERGQIGEAGILTEVRQRLSTTALFLAYSTDSFLAGHATEEELCTLKPENLLELRVFSETWEVCYRRSYVGENFQWRLASEEDIPKDSYLVQYQTLDINWNKTQAEGNFIDPNGNRVLYTTVGGKYRLPIGLEEDCTQVISYIAYDENGMAKIVDYRLCGFGQREQMEEAEKVSERGREGRR